MDDRFAEGGKEDVQRRGEQAKRVPVPCDEGETCKEPHHEAEAKETTKTRRTTKHHQGGDANPVARDQRRQTGNALRTGPGLSLALSAARNALTAGSSTHQSPR